MASSPIASVVVATFNRAELLARLLNALELQDATPFEVVVVDDASTDATAALLAERAGSTTAYTLIALRQERNQGPAAARNRGWRTATAPVVCFTDDDCIPQKGWLQAHLVAIESGADLVQGKTMPVAEQRHRSSPFSRTIQRDRDCGYYETCNISYRRDVLERVDGFDEQFRFPFGEDIDLAWRAIDVGYRVVFNHLAEVQHEIWPFSWPSFIADVRRREGLVLAVHKHPHLRRQFTRPWCVNPPHEAALIAGAALVIAAVKPRSYLRWAGVGAAVTNYYGVAREFRYAPRLRRQWPAYVVLMLGSDLAEIGVMAAASVKYRTILL